MEHYFQVEGESGGMWGVEQEYYATLREAQAWVNKRGRFDPFRIVKVTHEVVASNVSEQIAA